MATSEVLKRAVGYKAAEFIEDGMIVGLGTGSTVRHLLDAIAERRAAGELSRIVGVPTSLDTHRRASQLGIPLGTLADHPAIDLALDGADELDPALDLIKGLGGALLREKVVITASRAFIVMVDETKLVSRLGEKVPLPVEVDEFSLATQLPYLRQLGADPTLRLTSGGEPFRTDGGHVVVDCRFTPAITDPRALAAALDSRPGVMEHGLFLDCVTHAIVSRDAGCNVLSRES